MTSIEINRIDRRYKETGGFLFDLTLQADQIIMNEDSQRKSRREYRQQS
jgi:hypothetical protein